LYWLDLSDPENPFIIDELEQPGVSDYMHIISESLVLGIGREATSIDGFTRFTGVKVELYQAAGNELTSLDKYLAEGEYSYTNVAYDQMAFMSFQPTDADYMYFTIPITEYYNAWYSYSQNLYVFKVYFDGTLEMVTKLSHINEEEAQDYYWYFDSIERCVIIEDIDRIYTISNNKIQMYDMTNMFELVASTELNSTQSYYWVD